MPSIIKQKTIRAITENQILINPSKNASKGTLLLSGNGDCIVEAGVLEGDSYVFIESQAMNTQDKKTAIAYYDVVREVFRFSQINGVINARIISEEAL